MTNPLFKTGFRLALLATALACVVVVLGAFTRLVHAGLGCPDWPGCYGHLLWPQTHEEIANAQALFPEAPVETDKTWPEMVHRYFAGTLGLLIAALGVLAWCQRGRQLPLKLPLALVALVIVQALFGMWTVTLKLWPQVVTAHLLGGMATLSLLWLLTQRLGGWGWWEEPQTCKNVSALRPWAALGLIAVVVQIGLGGWTSANYAALACTDLPTCHGAWWPAMNFAQGFNLSQHIGPNYLGGLLDNEARTAIHFTHRLGAVTVTVILLLLAWRLWRLHTQVSRRLAAVLVAVLIAQVLLGVSNILWALPLATAVAHNATGALLLLTMVTINHRIYTVKGN